MEEQSESRQTIGSRAYRIFSRLTRHLSENQVLLVLAVLTGALAGMGTYLFEILLSVIKNLCVAWFQNDTVNIPYLVYPAIGIILSTLFVKYIVKDNISHGVTRVLHAMSKKGSRIAGHNCWTSLVGGATTIGFGGSVGPEAPIVLTGAAIGSNIGKFAHLNYRDITLMLGCGTAAALAAIFKAPITGLVFVLEILMLDITAKSIIPLLISSITASTIALSLRGFDTIISVDLSHKDLFHIEQIPFFIILGIICGFISYYFTSMNAWVAAKIGSIPRQRVRWGVAGALLGVLIFIFPPLYGEGYEAFVSLMHGDTTKIFENSLFWNFREQSWVLIIYVIAIIFFKVIAMSATNAAGGVGGTFAPSLFVGAFTGAAMAIICNTVFGFDVSIAAFTLVGMAGVMSGVMNAPLTSIFLIAELSNGYKLFIPLMIVACISFAVDYYFDPDSIYTKSLRKRGELLTHDKDQSVFVFLKLEQLMEKDFTPISGNDTLGDIVKIISSAHRNIFPVLDSEEHLLGVVQLDDLREDMFQREKWGTPISTYMIEPPDKVLIRQQIQDILPRFEYHNTWMLPVVDRDNHWMGFISKSRILNAYRQQLVNISQN